MLTPSPALLQALSGKELLIFDFDGTIADTSSLHAQAFADVLSPLGISVCYQIIAGMRTAEALLSCFRNSGLELPSSSELQLLVAQKQQRVQQLINLSLEPLPRVSAFLNWTQPLYSMALVTSGSRATVTLALNKLGYGSLFPIRVFAEDVKAGKPDPEGFLIALDLHKCAPLNALVFEDSEAGFQAAAAANLDFINVKEHNIDLFY
jgi:sugar-phosphatase